MRELPSGVHSVGGASAGLPRIVSLPQLTSIRTTNKGGSTHWRSHIVHIRTKGDLDRGAVPGANRMVEGAKPCSLVRSIHPSTDKVPRMALTYRLVSLPLSLQVPSRGNRGIVIVSPVAHSWRRFRSVGQSQTGARRTQGLQASQNKGGVLGTREGLESQVLRSEACPKREHAGR